jgi:ABC-type multidrug transport system permease subunit
MIGLLLCILSAKFLFHVPLRGSVLVLTGVSVLYLLVTLGTGLLISSVTKSQFIASQVAITGTFLPAMMLSGFLFDLRSMPAAIRTITYILPARYYVALLQTIFLAGDIWSVIVPNAAVLAAMAAGLLLLARVATAPARRQARVASAGAAGVGPARPRPSDRLASGRRSAGCARGLGFAMPVSRNVRRRRQNSP